MEKLIDGPTRLGNCEFSVIEQDFESVSDILTYYDRIRGYLQHEDGLINSRLTWSLTVHGFLFAIYGITLSKISDIFMDLHKNGNTPLLHNTVSALFFFQVLIALFGTLVARRSRGAIIAAHNAIHHLYTIALNSPICKVSPVCALASCAISAGPCIVTPESWLEVSPGCDILVNGGHEDEEIVRVIANTENGFEATFARDHAGKATLRPLGRALLPKIICGGASKASTEGAQRFYLALPSWAMVIWMILSVASIGLFVTSIALRSKFFH